ncbi:MAG: TMEM165/GDT1 family protein [Gammaproteobacteria bacterium]|jgi:hypothetical protein|nr:TMEM165/GDT1 family protein [Gammaproteobacteria bacterium]
MSDVLRPCIGWAAERNAGQSDRAGHRDHRPVESGSVGNRTFKRTFPEPTGASLALIVASGLGGLAGGIVSQYVSEKVLHYVAAAGFIAIGLGTLVRA